MRAKCVGVGYARHWQHRLLRYVDASNPVAEKLKFCVIPNTLEVTDLWVSAPVVEEAKKNANLVVVGEAHELPFDTAGNLKQEQLFPHSVRGRRVTSPSEKHSSSS